VGTNNRQRRAAKKKARGRSTSQPRAAAPSFDQPGLTAADVRALLVDLLDEIEQGATTVRRSAEHLAAPPPPLTSDVARAAVHSLMRDVVRGATVSGWSPSDLVEVVRRRARAGDVPRVVGLLHDEAARHSADRLPSAWRDDLHRAGPSQPVVLDGVDGMQQALELLAVLARLPPLPAVLPAPGSREQEHRGSASDDKLLTRVQALLAKAEATEFDDEAEALTAKAQELISRHSLDRLLAQAATGRSGVQPEVRRLWLEAPYVFAKGMLVHVVADANRCRSVISEALGCCTLVGAAGDLDAVEVLVPSLLLQAHVAMTRCGRRTDGTGTSRTRSFRQSFLLAYAQRIGERLQSADERVVASTGGTAALVPVLTRHRQRVDAACEALFPQTVARGGSVNNPQGWWAGLAAADQAQLGSEQAVLDPAQDRAAS
jgi:hypothetical protein